MAEEQPVIVDLLSPPEALPVGRASPPQASEGVIMSLLSSDDEHASSQNASHEAGQPVDDVYDDSEYNAYQQTAAAEPMVGAGRAKEDDAEIDHSEASTPNDDARHHRNSDDGHAEDTPTQETMSLQLQWWAFQRWHCHAKSLQEEEKSNDAVALADHGDADAHEEYAAIAGEQEGEPAPTRKRKQRAGGVGNWRRRAGDVRPSASKSVEEDTVIDAEQAAQAQQLAKGLTADALRNSLLAFGLKPGSRAKVAMAVRLVRARRAATASEALYARATVATEARGLADEPANSHATAGGAPEQPQLPPRFDGARAGRINGSLEQCRLCSGAIPPPRRTFCCDECVHFHLLRTSGSHVRKSLALRDGRICSECGVDAGAAYEAAKKAVREARVQGAPSAEAALALSVAGGPFEGKARLSTFAQRRARWGGRGGRGRGGRGFRGGMQPRVQEGSFWQADHRVAVHEGGGCCSLENMRTLCSGCHAKVTAEQAARRAQDRRKGKAAASTVARAGPGTLVLGLQGATAAAAAPSRGVSDHTHGRAYAAAVEPSGRGQSTAPWATVLSNDENADHQQPWLGPSSSSNSSCGSSCGGDGTGDESDGEGSDVGDEAEDDEDVYPFL